MYFTVSDYLVVSGYHNTEVVQNQLFPVFNNIDLYMQYIFMSNVISAVNYFNFVNAIPI